MRLHFLHFSSTGFEMIGSLFFPGPRLGLFLFTFSIVSVPKPGLPALPFLYVCGNKKAQLIIKEYAD